MEVIGFELGPIGTNAYLVLAPERGEAVLVDAPPGAPETVPDSLEARGCKLVALLLTHGHWDHTLGAPAIRDRGVPVFAHEGDRELFTNPSLMSGFAMPGLEMVPTEVDTWVNPGQPLELLGEAVEIRHVPGHAPGSVLFYFPSRGWAFSGDAIFAGGVGRFDLPFGSWPELEHSIRSQIYTLPDHTRLFPGHGPETTVGREKATNPFVTASA